MISSDLAILIISSILIEGYKIQTDFGSVEVLGPFTFVFWVFKLENYFIKVCSFKIIISFWEMSG